MYADVFMSDLLTTIKLCTNAHDKCARAKIKERRAIILKDPYIRRSLNFRPCTRGCPAR